MTINKLLDELNQIEARLKRETESAREFYGEHTDDAEMYIGQLRDKANAEIDDLLEEYNYISEEAYFDGEKWVLRSEIEF